MGKFQNYLTELFGEINPVKIIDDRLRADEIAPYLNPKNSRIYVGGSEFVYTGRIDKFGIDYFLAIKSNDQKIYRYQVAFNVNENKNHMCFWFKLTHILNKNKDDEDEDNYYIEDTPYTTKEMKFEDRTVALKVYNAILFLIQKEFQKRRYIKILSFSGAKEKVKLYDRLVNKLAADYDLVDLFKTIPRLNQLYQKTKEIIIDVGEDNFEDMGEKIKQNLTKPEVTFLETVDLQFALEKNDRDETLYILAKKNYVKTLIDILEDMPKDQLSFKDFVAQRNKEKRLAREQRRNQIIANVSSPETSAETGERMETIGSPFYQDKT